MWEKNKILKFLSFKSITDKVTKSVEIDNEERSRRRLFSVFLIFLIAFLIIYGISHIRNNRPEFGIPNLIIAFVMIIMLLRLHKQKNAVVLYRILAFFALAQLVYWTINGLAEGYSSVWLVAFPPFVYFLLGKKEGSIWVIAVSTLFIIMFLDLIPFLTVYQYPISYIVRLLSAFSMVVLFTYYYETMREVYKEGMESDRNKLLEERNHITIAKNEAEKFNALLKKEMRERRIAQEEIRIHRDNLENIISARTEEIHKKNRALRNALDKLEKTNSDLQISTDNLAVSENRYRLLADHLTDLIWSTDMTLRFLYMSPSVKKMYGYSVEEGLSLPVNQWCTPESYTKTMQVFMEQLEIESSKNADPDRSVIIELEQIKKDGTIFPVEIKVSFLRDENKNPIGTVGITRDITDRVKAHKEKENIQSQLSQAQKMEAIGTLVGGLAHDFNNVLGGIIGSFDLLKLYLDKENLINREEIESYISLGMESSKRSIDLIKQLLTLSKKHDLSLTTVDINKSLKHILVLCKNSFSKNISLDFQISEGNLYILAEAVQIEQVLLNLCINAAHAMTIMRGDNEAQGGILSVNGNEIISDGTLLKKHSECAAYLKWVCVRIKDTGIGIQPDIAERIFEPFYSTKKQEEGTGLGLSISYSIVKQHRGFIDVESEPGKGSIFSIYLPAHESGTEDITARKKPAPFIKGSGTILIIDDEQFIVNVVRGILCDCGYQVLSSSNPDKGIAIFRESHAEISAVILDLSMPGRSGIEVFQEMKKIKPSVKAILTSGMLDDEMKNKAAGLGINYFLHKPFNGVELSSAIEEIING